MNTFECKICNQVIEWNVRMTKVYSHIRSHGYSLRQYYDTFLKTSTDGICLSCGKTAPYNRRLEGYYSYCSKSCAQKDISSRPEMRQIHHETLCKQHQETNIQELATLAKQTPEFRKKKSDMAKKYLQENPEQHRRMCEAYSNCWKDPQWRTQRIDQIHSRGERDFTKTDKFKQMMRERVTRLNKTTDRLRNAASANGRLGINGLEKRVLNLLNKISPDMFEYVGDFKFRVGSKYPDFVCKELNLIIEAFGSHWHESSDEKYKTDYFRSLGYQCLVLWDYETDVEMCDKIKLFVAVIKQDELLGSPKASIEDITMGNQHPSLISKDKEGSETSQSNLSPNGYDEMATSVLPLITQGDDIVRTCVKA